MRKTFFRPLKRAHGIAHIQNPQLKAGGYVSYDGYAADYRTAISALRLYTRSSPLSRTESQLPR
jgi:hypothetical protein